jgi:cytosine/adenosine deaminase-related metal-dependent hydrolase
LVTAVGRAGDEPAGAATLDARVRLVTPALINTHQHIFQNLTRSYRPGCHCRLLT